jgi:hypothetical protein
MRQLLLPRRTTPCRRRGGRVSALRRSGWNGLDETPQTLLDLAEITEHPGRVREQPIERVVFGLVVTIERHSFEGAVAAPGRQPLPQRSLIEGRLVSEVAVLESTYRAGCGAGSFRAARSSRRRT